MTPENLMALGVERLAEILVTAADSRPDLKRRLRMELAAEQGADHLSAEIDRRLGSLETSRSKVSWRQRPTFVRDLDVLRVLIGERLAGLDPDLALNRMWLFMDLARPLNRRVKDRDGEMAATFLRAAENLGDLIARNEAAAGAALAEAILRDPPRWTEWLAPVLQRISADTARATLVVLAERPVSSGTGWVVIVRQLADAASDIDLFAASFSPMARKSPAFGAEIARRLLAAGRIEEAGERLRATSPKGATDPEFEWESVWIDYLDHAGRGDEAQEVRWASFERTLSAERARAFTKRLADFDDVEAETRAFEHAAAHPDLSLALQFLMDWPSLPEAARLIAARPDDLDAAGPQAELWAGALRIRYPVAAHALLRAAAATAFRRRDFATCDRLTAEAETILPG